MAGRNENSIFSCSVAASRATAINPERDGACHASQPELACTSFLIQDYRHIRSTAMIEQDHPYNRGRLLCTAALCLLALGCQHSVRIQFPTDGSYKTPVTTLTVKFHPEFKPGTFDANLSGQTITNLFQPAPAPGGVSTASIVFPPNYMDFHYNNNKQKLIVEGDFTQPVFYFFGIPTRFTRDSSDFTPPYVRVFRGRTSFDSDLTLRERETIAATAFVVEAPAERLVVTLTGHPLVSLNDQPAGQNIEVVIEPNDRRADFTVRGIQTGGEVFRIRAIATGYSCGVGAGRVLQNQ
jgi:hypothetical protein